MKKTHLIITILAATIMVSSVPLHAKREGRISKTVRTARNKVRAAKEKAMKQLNESLDRFKRCIKLQCTRWEALKAARDVTIALTTLIAIMSGTGTVLQKPYKEYQGHSEHPELEKTLYGAGAVLRYPGKKIGKAAAKVGKPITKRLKAIAEEDETQGYDW